MLYLNFEKNVLKRNSRLRRCKLKAGITWFDQLVFAPITRLLIIINRHVYCKFPLVAMGVLSPE
jgi:hypothetical protein